MYQAGKMLAITYHVVRGLQRTPLNKKKIFNEQF
jgi:hypothetical protein